MNDEIGPRLSELAGAEVVRSEYMRGADTERPPE